MYSSIVLDEESWETRALKTALKKIDDKFDKSMMEWAKSLYDPETGMFYYSVSARDHDIFAPDIESTSQMMTLLGMGIKLYPEKWTNKRF